MALDEVVKVRSAPRPERVPRRGGVVLGLLGRRNDRALGPCDCAGGQQRPDEELVVRPERAGSKGVCACHTPCYPGQPTSIDHSAAASAAVFSQIICGRPQPCSFLRRRALGPQPARRPSVACAAAARQPLPLSRRAVATGADVCVAKARVPQRGAHATDPPRKHDEHADCAAATAAGLDAAAVGDATAAAGCHHGRRSTGRRDWSGGGWRGTRASRSLGRPIRKRPLSSRYPAARAARAARTIRKQ